jgi:hypothetical protein
MRSPDFLEIFWKLTTETSQKNIQQQMFWGHDACDACSDYPLQALLLFCA